MSVVDSLSIGERITVKIVKNPTNLAARKTLQRLLGQDPDIRKKKGILKRARARFNEQRTRAGRPWIVRRKKIHPILGQVGEQGAILVTWDVMNCLPGVERFVEIEKG